MKTWIIGLDLSVFEEQIDDFQLNCLISLRGITFFIFTAQSDRKLIQIIICCIKKGVKFIKLV